MSYLVLARKYRPAAFEQVVGQDGVVQTLRNAIEMDRVAHAYLFCGARGVGKTTVARLLAKALNCEKGPTADPDDDCSICREIARGASPDVFEIDGASNTGVDDVRQLRDNSQYMPSRSRFKIYIIDEVHMLSTSAFNALLKTLEEPPAHVKFIFATTEPHKIPLTVLSRCQRFDFKRIPSDTILGHLERVLDAEGMRIDTDGLRVIARQADGSIRDALSLADQILAFGGEQISSEQVREALGLTGTAVYEQVVAALCEQRPGELMSLVQRLFDEGHDLRRFVEGLLWHVHHLILFRTLDDPGDLVDLLPEERERMRKQAAAADPLRWHQVFDVLARTAAELARNPYPRLVLETALLRLSVIEPVVAVDDLLARVEHLARQVADTGRPEPRQASGGFRPPPARPRDPAPAETAPPPPGPDSQPSSAGQATPSQRPTDPAPGKGLSGDAAWEELVAWINTKKPLLGSCLLHGRPHKVEPGQVTIAFKSGTFFAEQISAKRTMRDLESFCSGFFGQPTKVRIEDLADNDVPSLAQTRDKADQESEEEKRRQAREHPMVQEAIRVFGAEVDHIKTNPGRDG